jgi:hypothetical protein
VLYVAFVFVVLRVVALWETKSGPKQGNRNRNRKPCGNLRTEDGNHAGKVRERSGLRGKEECLEGIFEGIFKGEKRREVREPFPPFSSSPILSLHSQKSPPFSARIGFAKIIFCHFV